MWKRRPRWRACHGLPASRKFRNICLLSRGEALGQKTGQEQARHCWGSRHRRKEPSSGGGRSRIRGLKRGPGDRSADPGERQPDFRPFCRWPIRFGGSGDARCGHVQESGLYLASPRARTVFLTRPTSQAAAWLRLTLRGVRGRGVGVAGPCLGG